MFLPVFEANFSNEVNPGCRTKNRKGDGKQVSERRNERKRNLEKWDEKNEKKGDDIFVKAFDV